MRIGIVVSSSLDNRTGVEEYIYQLLKHLPMVDDYKNHQFFLYSRKNLKWPFKWGWTQLRLSWEMLKNKPDVLFIPAHTFPIIHPKKLVLAIQGLEYERGPEYYSYWQRKKMRFLTKRNAKKAEKIIMPSETTKKDLVKFYKIESEKIFVIPHGVNKYSGNSIQKTGKYILYLGSGHKRKNIEGLKKAFRILKEKYNISHKLILAGGEKYIGEEEKWQLLKNADIFVYPSFYEGFGLPVLEAQRAGTPVVASNVSSLAEILGESAFLIDPHKPKEIAEAVYKIIKDKKLREKLIEKGYENVKRFNWKECARKTLELIIGNS